MHVIVYMKVLQWFIIKVKQTRVNAVSHCLLGSCEGSVPTAKHKYMYHSHKSKAKHLILKSKHKT